MVLAFKGRKSSSSSKKATRHDDTLFGTDTVEALLAVSEGPIKGWPKGASSFFVGDVPLLDEASSAPNISNFELRLLKGTDPADSIKLNLGGTAATRNIGLELRTPGQQIVAQGTKTQIDFIDFRFVIQRLLGTNKDGGEFATNLSFKIEVKPRSSSTWQIPFSNEIPPNEDLSGASSYRPGVTTPGSVVNGAYRETYLAATAPTAAKVVGAMWFQTGKTNWEPAIWNGTGWVTPTSLAAGNRSGYPIWTWTDFDGAIRTAWYSGGGLVPPPGTLAAGDFLISPQSGEQIYSYNDTAWVGFQSWASPNVVAPGTININGLTRSSYPKEYRVPVARINEPYDIRVTRITAATTKETFADINFESIQEVNQDVRSYPNLAIAWLTIKATDTFTSIPEFTSVMQGLVIPVPSNCTFNETTKLDEYTGIWDGSFKMAYTNSPGWHAYNFIMNARYGKNSYYPEVADKWDFYAFARHCVLHEMRFNEYITEARPLNELINYIVGIAGGRYIDRGDGYSSVLWDADDQPAVAIFAPENTIEGSFTYSFTDVTERKNDFKVSFKNPELNYREDRLRVYDQNSIDVYGRNAEEFVAVGCRNNEEAVRRGRLRLATALTECIIVNFKTNRLGRYLTPFQVILIADDQSTNVLSGRVLNHEPLATGTSVLPLRDQIYLEAGIAYSVSFTLSDGSGGLKVVSYPLTVTSPGQQSALRLTQALSEPLPEYAVFSIGTPKAFRVTSIVEADDDKDSLDITAIEVNRQKWAFVDGKVDLRDILAVQTGPLSKYVYPVSNARIVPEVTLDGHYNLVVMWNPSETKLIRGYRLYQSLNQGPMNLLAEPSDTQFTIPDVTSGTYVVSIVAVGLDGTTESPPVTVQYIVSNATSLRSVAAPQNLRLIDEPETPIFRAINPRFTWDAATDPLVSRYLVEIVSPANRVVHTERVEGQLEFQYSLAANRADNGNVPLRQFTIQVRSIDSTGNMSNPVTLVVSHPPPAILDFQLDAVTENVFVSYNQPTGDWAGTLIWMETVDGFNPLTTTPRYDGTNTFVSLPAKSETNYYVRVAAYDSYGKTGLNIGPQKRIYTSNKLFDPNGPAQPTGLTLSTAPVLLADGSLVASITATWDAPLATDTAYGFPEIEFGEGVEPGVSWLSDRLPATQRTWTRSGFRPGITHSVRLRFRPNATALGLGPYTVVKTIVAALNLTPPSNPTNVVVTAGFGLNTITMTAPPEKDLDRIEVWAVAGNNTSAVPAGGAALIGTIPAGSTQFFDYAVSGGQKTYWLRSVNSSGTVATGFVRVLSAVSPQVQAAQLAAGIIDDTKVASALLVNVPKVETSIPAAKTRDIITVNGKLYRWDTTLNAYTAAIDPVDVRPGLTSAQILSLEATKVAGQLTNAQIADLAAGKLTGQLTSAQIASLDAAKVAGQLTDAQVAALSANKLIGQVVDTQLAGIGAAKVTGQLTDAQLASLSAAKVSGQLTSAQIADLAANKVTGQLVTAQLADNVITLAKFAVGTAPIGNVSALPNPSGYTGPAVILNTGDGKVYRLVSGAWVTNVAAADIAGQLAAGQIAALEAAKITGQLQAGQLAAIEAAKVSGQLTSAQIATLDANKVVGGLVASQILSVNAATVTGQLTDAQLASLSAAKVSGQLTSAQIADLAANKVTGQLVSSQIADNTITLAKFASGTAPIGTVSSLPAPSGYAGPAVILNSADGKVYRLVSGTWVTNVAASDVAGQIQAAQIAALEAVKITGTLSSAQIASLDAAKIAGQLTDAQVAALSANKVTGQLVTTQLADNAITLAKFATGTAPIGVVSALPNPSGYAGPAVVLNTADGKVYRLVSGAWTTSITAADVTGQIAAGQIAALEASKITGQLTNAQLATIDAAKVSGQLADTQLAALSANKITGPIVATQIDSVYAAKISGQIQASQIAALEAAKISGQLTTAQIASLDANKVLGGLVASQILSVAASTVTGQLTNAQIADLAATKVSGQLTNAQIADLAANKVTGTLVASQIASVTAAVITGQIQASQIAALEAAKVTGQLTTAQIISLDANKVLGGLVASQILSVAASTVTGQLTDAQVAGLAAAKVTGQITGTQITDNAITTVKIAAGNVVTASLAAGAVTTSRLAVASDNRAFNPDFSQSARGWAAGNNANLPGVTLAVVGTIGLWAPDGFRAIGISSSLAANSQPSGAYMDMVSYDVLTSTGTFSDYTVLPGQWYEASACISAHRCRGRVVFQWFNASGASLSFSDTGTTLTDNAPSGGSYKAFPKSFIVAQAPANAAVVRVFFRADTPTTGGTPYIFVSGLMFCVAPQGAAQTEPSPYSSPGMTFIEGGNLVTGTVSADRIVANSLTTAQIQAAGINADRLVANSITAGQIAANAITAGKIDAAAITAREIVAGAILASKLSVASVNLAFNSEFAQGTLGYGWASNGNTLISSTAIRTDYCPSGFTAFAVQGNTASTSGVMHTYVPAGVTPAGVVNRGFPCTPGQIIEISAYLSVVNGGTGSLIGGFFNASGGSLSTFSSNGVTLPLNGGSPASWEAGGGRAKLIATAPAGATYFVLTVQWASPGTTLTGTPYIFMSGIMIASATASQVASGEVSPYVPEGMTTIHGGSMVTNSLAAGVIVANSITTAQIAAGGVSADRLVANSITTSQVQAGGVNADRLVANSITAGQIATDAVTAGKISAGAITAREITAGAITGDRIAANTIVGTQLVVGTIGTREIIANVITTGQIQAGGVNADRLVANSITAGQIAANAITAEKISAGAITAREIAAGSIVASKLQVASTNLAIGADNGQGIINYASGYNDTGFATTIDTNMDWCPPGFTCISFALANTGAKTGIFDLALTPRNADGSLRLIQCRPGQTFEASAYISTHRCTAQVMLAFLDASFNVIAQFVGSAIAPSAYSTGNSLVDWNANARSQLFATAPANTTACYVIVRGTNPTSSTPAYFFSSGIMVSQTAVGQNEVSPYVDPNTTTIAGAMIYTGSVAADRITANSLTTAQIQAGGVNADRLVANSITAGQIAAGTITATQIAGRTITAGNLVAGTITASEIAAGTITATQIAVRTISAANLIGGTITAYEIGAGVITTGQIQAGGVNADRLVAGSITATQIAAGTITGDRITGNTIVGTQLIAGTIGTREIIANSITTGQLAAGGVNADRLVAGSITAGQLAANAVTAEKISAGAITARELATGAITTNKLTIANRKINVVGLNIRITGATGIIQWDAGTLYYQDDNGVTQVTNVAAGSFSKSGNAWYAVVWFPGKTTLDYTTDINYTFTYPSAVTLATYDNSYAGLSVYFGPTYIDGDRIITGSIWADRIKANSITTNQLTAGGINADRLIAGTITATQIAAGTITGNLVAANTIQGANILALTIGTREIVANSITTGQIAAGAVNADRLIAGSITAGQIAANAITAEKISAGAITAREIAAGSILASKLKISGGNVAFNPGMTSGTLGWSKGYSGTTNIATTLGTSTTWCPGGLTAVSLYSGNIPANQGSFDLDNNPVDVNGAPNYYSISADRLYEASAYVSAHRCKVYLFAGFYKADGTYFQEVASAPVSYTTPSNGNSLEDWNSFARVRMVFRPPSGTVKMKLFFRAQEFNSDAASQGAFMFVSGLMLSAAWEGQTETSPYVPAGATIVDGGQILTDTIGARQIISQSITSDEIKVRSVNATALIAGTITGYEIAAATITGTLIAGRTITAGNLVAGTITAGEIAAGTITATQIAVRTISAANLIGGTITAYELGANIITTNQIQAGGVNADRLIAGTITATQIAAGTITGDRITGSTIVGTQLVAGTIGTREIIANVITTGQIQAGAVNADRLVAGSITATQIAAGTITAEKISAGAITAREIAAGSIVTSKLAISSDNRAYNADASQTIKGWRQGSNTGIGTIGGPGVDFYGQWAPDGFRPVQINANTGGAATGYMDLHSCEVDAATGVYGRYKVQGGVWYEVSACISAHRVTCRVLIGWFNSSGTNIGYSDSPNKVPSNGSSGGSYKDFPKTWVFGQAPAAATSCEIFFRAENPSAASPYMFVSALMFCVAPMGAAQTEPSPYSSPGLTFIDGGNLLTGTIYADRLVALTITGDKIAANAISTDKLVANAITADKIAANAITAEKISAGAITAREIAGYTITADKIGTRVITAEKMVGGTITGYEIAGATITGTLIAGRTITAGNLLAGTITAYEIATRTITADQISGGTITGYEIKGGTITADKLLANSITAAQISAGAIGVDQLAAGAVTADKIGVGLNTGNMLYNSDFLGFGAGVLPFGMTTYASHASLSATTVATNRSGASWQPPGMGSLEVVCSGTPQSGAFFEVYYPRPTQDGGSSRFFPVLASQWYEASAYVSTHRCKAVVVLNFFDNGGNLIGESGSNSPENDPSSGPLVTWRRCTIRGQAPVNAATCAVTLRMVANGGNNPYNFWTGVYLGRATANQTSYSDWMPASQTVIVGGTIATNSLSADKIIAGTITTDKLQAGSINADRLELTTLKTRVLAAGAVTADTITVGNGNLSSLISGTNSTKIDGASISANSIRANQLQVGMRGINVTGLNIRYTAATRVIAWDDGSIYYTDNSGNPQGKNITAGSFTVSGNNFYSILWHFSKTTLDYNTDINFQINGNPEWVTLATYDNSYSGLAVNYGATYVDGDRIITGSIKADRIAANQIQTSHLAAGVITADKIAVGAVIADKISSGTLTAGQINIGSDRFRLWTDANGGRIGATNAAGNAWRLAMGNLAPWGYGNDDFGFVCWNGNNQEVIRVSSNGTRLSGAIIDAASIGSAQIANLSVQNAHIENLTIGNGKIGAGQVTTVVSANSASNSPNTAGVNVRLRDGKFQIYVFMRGGGVQTTLSGSGVQTGVLYIYATGDTFQRKVVEGIIVPLTVIYMPSNGGNQHYCPAFGYSITWAGEGSNQNYYFEVNYNGNLPNTGVSIHVSEISK